MEKLTIATCSFLVPEISQVIHSGDYPDVELVSFRSNCSASSFTVDSIDKIIAEAQNKNNDIFILNGTCNPKNSSHYNYSKLEFVHLNQCFEVFASSEMIFHFISKGYYIVTNGWLKHYNQHIENWGFQHSDASDFFRESMKGILFLDTKIPGDFQSKLEDLSNYMGLPYEILPVGLNHCKLFIDNLVNSWRVENEKKGSNIKISNITRQAAEYSVIYNELEELVNTTDENEIIDKGIRLAEILFAPHGIRYTKHSNDNSEIYKNQGISNNTANVNGNFSFKVNDKNNLLGEFEIFGIQFPQFLNKYEEMGKTIGFLLGITIANARKYETILNQKSQITHYSNELKRINSTKDKFFAIIAHDLKNPFQSLLGLSSVLNEELQQGNLRNIKNYVSLIHQTSQNTFDLLVNLLEWSSTQTRRIEYKPGKLNVLETVNNVLDLLNTQAERKNISIKTEISENLEIYADKNMMQTVFRNLVSNAIKYSFTGGSVLIYAKETGSEIEFGVKDSGVGISAEKLESLFLIENAESTKGTAGEKGTGLGLLLCKEFVEKHFGKIWAESSENGGSTFIFSIPDK